MTPDLLVVVASKRANLPMICQKFGEWNACHITPNGNYSCRHAATSEGKAFLGGSWARRCESWANPTALNTKVFK
jgi:hypothetical protein